MPDMLVKLYDLPPAAPYLEALQAEGIVVRSARAFDRTLQLKIKNTN